MVKYVDGNHHFEFVKELIEEYTNWIGRDLGFQNLEAELNNPALKYSPPEGDVVLAIEDNKPLGIIAYHRHNDYRCELKRMYVRPEGRGVGIGEKLVTEILDRARDAGFKEIVLDTLLPFQAAIHIYEKFGFEECEPYYDNPFEDVVYMKRPL